MGTTIHFRIKEFGDKLWWNTRVRKLNQEFWDSSKTEPMRNMSDYKNGWKFCKTYGREPMHSQVLNMLRESSNHGFHLVVYDERTNETIETIDY